MWVELLHNFGQSCCLQFSVTMSVHDSICVMAIGSISWSLKCVSCRGVWGCCSCPYSVTAVYSVSVFGSSSLFIESRTLHLSDRRSPNIVSWSHPVHKLSPGRVELSRHVVLNTSALDSTQVQLCKLLSRFKFVVCCEVSPLKINEAWSSWGVGLRLAISILSTNVQNS